MNKMPTELASQFLKKDITPNIPTINAPAGDPKPFAPDKVDFNLKSDKIKQLREQLAGTLKPEDKPVKEIEPVEEIKPTEDKLVEDKPVENKPIEDKPKNSKSSRSSKNKNSTKKTTDDTENDPLNEEELFTDLSVIERSLCTFNDAEWEEEKEELARRDQSILFPEEMDAAQMRTVISQLVELKGLLQERTAFYNAQLLNLSNDKPEGLIERIKRINAKGSNEDERKRNAILACEHYELFVKEENRKVVVNLYEALALIREKVIFYRTLHESIDFKQRLINNMSTAIRADIATLPYGC